MDSHDWTVLGLVIDIVGALLLSVEAIKLENVRKLRDNVLIVMRRRLRQETGLGAILAGLTLAVILSFILAAITGDDDSGGFWSAVAFTAAVLAALAIAVIFTEPLIRMVSAPLAAVISVMLWVLDYIDRKTPDGTIGVIGAALLVCGFTFQAIGA